MRSWTHSESKIGIMKENWFNWCIIIINYRPPTDSRFSVFFYWTRDLKIILGAGGVTLNHKLAEDHVKLSIGGSDVPGAVSVVRIVVGIIGRLHSIRPSKNKLKIFVFLSKLFYVAISSGSIVISIGQLHPSQIIGPDDEEEEDDEKWPTNDEDGDDDDWEVWTDTLELDDDTLEEELEEAVAVNTRLTIGVSLRGSAIITWLLFTSPVVDSNDRSRSIFTISDPSQIIVEESQQCYHLPIFWTKFMFCWSSPSCSGVAGGRVLS